MADLPNVVLMAVRVSLAFSLVLIVIPAWVLRRSFPLPMGVLDQLFAALIHATFWIIVLVHLLVVIKLYDAIALLGSILATYLLILRYKERAGFNLGEALGMQQVVNLLAWLEREQRWSELRNGLIWWWRQVVSGVGSRLRQLVTNPTAGLLPVAGLLAAANIRFKSSFLHAAYPHIDAYVHLSWTKVLSNQQFYRDGVYPFGYHAVLSALAKMTGIDPYWLVRFVGPLAGVLLVLSVYHFALRVTRSYAASLLALMVYGLVTHHHFPSVPFRQNATLTQEFAAIFILPGLYFLWLYLKDRRPMFLLLYAEALAITGLVHLYAAVYFGLWAGLLTLVAVLFLKLPRMVAARVVGWTGVAGVLSLLPIGLGILLGGRLHASSIEMIQQDLGLQAATINWGELLGWGNPFLVVVIPLSLMLVFSVRRGAGGRQAGGLGLFLGLAPLLMLVLYQAPQLGLAQLTDPIRTGMFFALLLAVQYAAGFTVLERGLGAMLARGRVTAIRQYLAPALVLALALLVFRFYPPNELYRGMEEYDAAAISYLRINSQFPMLEWTVIAPTEQLFQVQGRGWHYELLRFVQDYTLEQAADPQFAIPIPTRHLFFYTEKRPLGLGREVNLADTAMELEPEGNDPFMQYYHNVSQRTILEAKMIRWLEAYRASHSGVSIYYEDTNLRIYYVLNEQVKGGVRP